MSTNNVPKKSRGRPAVDSERVVTRIGRIDLDAIDKFAADSSLNSDAPLGRPEAIRRIVRDWLISHGFMNISGK